MDNVGLLYCIGLLETIDLMGKNKPIHNVHTIYSFYLSDANFGRVDQKYTLTHTHTHTHRLSLSL